MTKLVILGPQFLKTFAAFYQTSVKTLNQIPISNRNSSILLIVTNTTNYGSRFSIFFLLLLICKIFEFQWVVFSEKRLEVVNKEYFSSEIDVMFGAVSHQGK